MLMFWWGKKGRTRFQPVQAPLRALPESWWEGGSRSSCSTQPSSSFSKVIIKFSPSHPVLGSSLGSSSDQQVATIQRTNLGQNKAYPKILFKLTLSRERGALSIFNLKGGSRLDHSVSPELPHAMVWFPPGRAWILQNELQMFPWDGVGISISTFLSPLLSGRDLIYFVHFLSVCLFYICCIKNFRISFESFCIFTPANISTSPHEPLSHLEDDWYGK